MENVKKINDELTIAIGQVTSEQLQQAAQEGFKSVLNLRSPNEAGFLTEEQQASALGLHYVNIPVQMSTISDQSTTEVLQQIDKLPKPALIHCKSRLRAGAMALMNVATRQGLTPQQAFEQAHKIGVDCSAQPQIKEFFEHYVSTHSKPS